MDSEKITSHKFLLLIYFISLVFADDITLKLTRDFIDEQIAGHIEVCNFIVCLESEKIEVTKKISSTMKCLVKIGTNFSDNILKPYRNLFIIKGGCPSTSLFLDEANSNGLFSPKNIFLLLHNINDRFISDDMNLSLAHTDTIGLFEKFKLTINSEVYLINKIMENEFQLIGIFKREPDQRIITEHILEWTLEKGFNDRHTECSAVRRQDLQGRIFPAGIVFSDKESLQHAEDLVDIHVDSLSKVDHLGMSLVVLSLNSSLNYTITTSWGIKINGKYDGMLGLLERGEAELAVTQSFPNEDRMKFTEYIDRVVRTSGAFIFLSPPLSFKRNIFILPFDTYVWLSCAGLMMIIIPAMYYANRFEIKRQVTKSPHQNSDLREKNENSLAEIFMLSVASFCMQGYHLLDSKGPAGRAVLITLFMIVIFLSVSYNAYIMVLLRTGDKSIITLQDLLKSKLELGVYDTPYNKYYYKIATDPTRKAIAEKVFTNKKRDSFVSLEQGIQRIRSDRYAFDVEKSPGYHMVKKILSEDEKCRLQQIKQSFTPNTEPMLSIKKNLPHTEMLKIKFKLLHERGFTGRIRDRIYTKKPPCTSNASFHFSIGLIDTHHIFEFLIYAMLSSITILIIENIVRRRKKKESSRNIFLCEKPKISSLLQISIKKFDK